MSWVLIATAIIAVSGLALALVGAVAAHRRADDLLLRLDALNRDIDLTVKQIETIADVLDEMEKEDERRSTAPPRAGADRSTEN